MFECRKTIFLNPVTVTRFLLIVLGIYAAIPAAYSQRLALIEPEKSAQVGRFAAILSELLSVKFRVLDDSLAATAARSLALENYFNLSTSEAKRIGTVVGCDYFVLVNSRIQRRMSFERAQYYEAYAAIYVISSRTGRLVFWTLKSVEADTTAAAEKKLRDSASVVTGEIAERISSSKLVESESYNNARFEPVPDDNSDKAKGLKPPIPYLRIKPEYTRIANLYEISATVDIEADIDETGKVVRTEIVRWAGYGLDESVTEAVRKMNWRPAMLNGNALPMRVLLRYNFKKIEKDGA